MIFKTKNLFQEAAEAMAAPPQAAPVAPQANAFKSPYDLSNQEALTKNLAAVKAQSSYLADKITTAYAKNEFNLKLGQGYDSNFDKFSVLIKDTLEINGILSDNPEVQEKLAKLISLAYYYAQSDSDKRYRVVHDKQVAAQITDAIFNRLLSRMKLSFLLQDTEFANLLRKAINAVMYYPKKSSEHEKK